MTRTESAQQAVERGLRPPMPLPEVIHHDTPAGWLMWLEAWKKFNPEEAERVQRLVEKRTWREGEE